ncbi:MAG: hypothetical protein ACI8Q1_002885 [Parvicella sp.]|jgi:hypothetical protein
MNIKSIYILLLACLIGHTTMGQQEYEAEEFVSDVDLESAVKQMQKSKFIGTQIACEQDSPELCDSSENAHFELLKGHVQIPVPSFTNIQHYSIDSSQIFSLSNPQINRLLIDCEPGTKVNAIADGEVTAIFKIPGNELVIMIKHGSYRSVYGTLEKLNVKVGDLVKKGDVIGKVSESNLGEMVFEIWKSVGQLNQALPVEQWIEVN